MPKPPLIRIGTRSSPMALAQVDLVRAELVAAYPDIETVVVPITTSGDRWAGPLSALGGKGAFTKEVDGALIAGEVDLAVHCMKDVPGDRPVPAGTVIAAYLERDDIHDALVHSGGLTLDQLPPGTRIGTSAVRRTAQLARHYPHLVAVPIRGNANSRLAKLDNGDVDALLLAVSGLHRIGRADRITQVLPAEVMCPPIGAGVIGLQVRQDDQQLVDVISDLNHPATWRETTAERMCLHALQGHCNTPIAGYATTELDGRINLRAMVFSIDGKTVIDAHEWGSDPTTLGASVALALLRQGAAELINTQGLP